MNFVDCTGEGENSILQRRHIKIGVLFEHAFYARAGLVDPVLTLHAGERIQTYTLAIPQGCLLGLMYGHLWLH